MLLPSIPRTVFALLERSAGISSPKSRFSMVNTHESMHERKEKTYNILLLLTTISEIPTVKFSASEEVHNNCHLISAVHLNCSTDFKNLSCTFCSVPLHQYVT